MNRFEIPSMIFAFLLVVGALALIWIAFWMLGAWVFGG